MLPDSSKSTLVELLQAQASAMADKPAFRFISGRAEEEELILTYRALDERAAAIAGHLQSIAAQGERALLLFPPGLDFVAAFFGCLYAGIVAVPVASLARNRGTSSLEAIFRASQPSLILGTTNHRQIIEQSCAHLPDLLQRPWIATDRVEDDCRRDWRKLVPDGRQTAFLQYTSGSTSSPKGVVLSHENLLYNAALIQRAFGNTREGSAVFWLPLYHDMGLIGGVVQPIYCGGSCTLWRPRRSCSGPPSGWRRYRAAGRRSAAAPISLTTSVSARSRPRIVRGWICVVGKWLLPARSGFAPRPSSSLPRRLLPAAFGARPFSPAMD